MNTYIDGLGRQFDSARDESTKQKAVDELGHAAGNVNDALKVVAILRRAARDASPLIRASAAAALSNCVTSFADNGDNLRAVWAAAEPVLGALTRDPDNFVIGHARQCYDLCANAARLF